MFTAPEVFGHKYNKKCDIWSCGVILYVMLSGEPPFPGKTKEELIEKITKGEYNFNGPAWKEVSPQAKQFIQKLLTVDPKKRLSAKKALKDPWLKETINKPAAATSILAAAAMSNLKSYHVIEN